LRRGDETLELRYRIEGDDRLNLRVGERTHVRRIAWSAPPELALEDERGVLRRFRVVQAGEKIWVHDGARTLAFDEVPRFPARIDAALAGSATAPMPGKVIKLLCAVGERVAVGQPLAVLEAMTMEHTVRATTAGAVERWLVAEGEQIAAGAPLAIVTATE
jgi:propionyl-CoA carboxylase alpha chain